MPTGKVRGRFQVKYRLGTGRLTVSGQCGNVFSKISKKQGHTHASIMLIGRRFRVKRDLKRFPVSAHHCQEEGSLEFCVHLHFLSKPRRNQKIMFCTYFTSIDYTLFLNYVFHSFGYKLKRANSAEPYFCVT